MKDNYLLYSAAMTAMTLMAALVGNILYSVVTRTPWSFEAFTFSLVLVLMFLFFYNNVKRSDKEDYYECK